MPVSPENSPPWWASSLTDALRTQESSAEGLSSREAAARL